MRFLIGRTAGGISSEVSGRGAYADWVQKVGDNRFLATPEEMYYESNPKPFAMRDIKELWQ